VTLPQGSSTRAFATPSTKPVFPVAAADTALPATFAWLAGAVSSAPIANPRLSVPDTAPVVQHFQEVLGRLKPQANEGDLSGLADEVAGWSAFRERATRLFTDD